MFIGVVAPFGYKSKDKQLIIDEYAANIVKRIFKMAEVGTSFINIAKILNSENIPTRSSYLKMSGKREYWKAKDISSILHNEVYIGTLINNRKGSVFSKTCQKKFK